MTGKPRVVVTRKIPAPVEEELTRLFDVQLNREDRPLDAAGLQDVLRTADGILPTVTDKLTAEVLGADPLKTRIIANFGVGFNNIDIAAAKTRGLTVTNTPDVLTDDTADIATTLLLMIARRAGEGERHVRSKSWTGWRPTHMLGTKVSGLAEDINEARRLIVQGVGIGFLPILAAENEVAKGKLWPLLHADFEPSYDVFLLARSQPARDTATQLFWDEVIRRVRAQQRT